MRLTLFAAQRATPKVNTLFRRLQILTLVGLGLAHGTNDAQKTMGVITLGFPQVNTLVLSLMEPSLPETLHRNK